MQYSLLSLVKRGTTYETLGGLFRDTNADVLEVTLYERILLVMMDLLEEFTVFIEFPNRELVQKFLSDKELLMKTETLTASGCASDFTCQTLVIY